MQVSTLIGIIASLLVTWSQAAELTGSQKTAIGRKIWQNECAGSVAGLTTWNGGEEFPSLGIGHFIWYPAGFQGKFEESWPEFAKLSKQRGGGMPAVGQLADSPWRSKREFEKNRSGSEMTALRTWLAAHVDLQTEFIMARSRAALPKILAAAPASERRRIEVNYHKVAASAQGTYALIDYVNFKGEGVQLTERYNGQGWGLLQVLGGMKEVPAGVAAAVEFAASGKRVLSRRVANSPPERGEKKWLEGWHNRCGTYAKPL